MNRCVAVITMSFLFTIVPVYFLETWGKEIVSANEPEIACNLHSSLSTCQSVRITLGICPTCDITHFICRDRKNVENYC